MKPWIHEINAAVRIADRFTVEERTHAESPPTEYSGARRKNQTLGPSRTRETVRPTLSVQIKCRRPLSQSNGQDTDQGSKPS